MRTCDAFRHMAAKSRELLLKITCGSQMKLSFASGTFQFCHMKAVVFNKLVHKASASTRRRAHTRYHMYRPPDHFGALTTSYLHAFNLTFVAFHKSQKVRLTSQLPLPIKHRTPSQTAPSNLIITKHASRKEQHPRQTPQARPRSRPRCPRTTPFYPFHDSTTDTLGNLVCLSKLSVRRPNPTQ